MSTTAPNTETQGAFATLAKALGFGQSTPADAANAAAEAIAKVIEEHGSETVGSLLAEAYKTEIAKTTEEATTAETAATTTDEVDPLEVKVDALTAKLEAFMAAKPAETVAKSSDAATTTTVPKSADVRATLIKSGVPTPLVEGLGAALDSTDQNAAAAARDTLAKLAGTTDLTALLKEHGTTEGAKPPEANGALTEDEKKAVAALARSFG